MAAYYNEIDEYAAQWLRNLIVAGHIAAGDVDTRSIEDVDPDDLRPYKQCHFFAGIGVWSLALRRAGWSDDRPVWTGSCPCQPFSAAGNGAGFDDARHLWPVWSRLVGERRPATLFGEQVAGSAVGPWIDLVQNDLEGMGYAFGAVAFPSAGVGAPHIRDRLYWLAHANGTGQQPLLRPRANDSAKDLRGGAAVRLDGHLAGRDESQPYRVADAGRAGPQRGEQSGQRTDAQCAAAERSSAPGGMEYSASDGRQQRWPEPSRRSVVSGCGTGGMADAEGGRRGRRSRILGGIRPAERLQAGEGGPAGPTNGLWRDADWLFCRDGKWRPVESGTFPLAHGATARVGRLRAYGNAINAEAARAFIMAAGLD